MKGEWCQHPQCLNHITDDNWQQNNRCHQCSRPMCWEHLYPRPSIPQQVCADCLEELAQQRIRSNA